MSKKEGTTGKLMFGILNGIGTYSLISRLNKAVKPDNPSIIAEASIMAFKTSMSILSASFGIMVCDIYEEKLKGVKTNVKQAIDETKAKIDAQIKEESEDEESGPKIVKEE